MPVPLRMRWQRIKHIWLDAAPWAVLVGVHEIPIDEPNRRHAAIVVLCTRALYSSCYVEFPGLERLHADLDPIKLLPPFQLLLILVGLHDELSE